MKCTIFFSTLLALAFVFQGCYYDNEETLYPVSGCDTTNITYSKTITSIMSSKCNTCHNVSIASGGVVTENYAGLSVVAANGKLWNAVKWIDNISNMPQGQDQLPECDLTKIDLWIKAGFPEN